MPTSSRHTKRLDQIGQAFCLIKIEEIFKLFIQGNTQDKSQFSGGAELSGFNGTDRISGYADHISQLLLRQFSFRPSLS